MKKEKKILATASMVFWLLVPSKILAQQDSARTLNDVVVTATKFAKNAAETGKVLTVIDEKTLKQSAGKDLSQLLNEQVGLVVNGANSNLGKNKSIYLRGAGSEYTLILIDGFPINDPSGAGDSFDLRLLPIDLIERIEILKGSQSTLYGSDAIGGVINIITKTKGNKPIGGSGTLTYGSYNTLKATLGLSGTTPLIDYTVGYTHFKTDGVSEAKDTTRAKNFDKDGYELNSLQVNLGINVTKSLSIRPFLKYSDYSGKTDADAFTDAKNSYAYKLVNFGFIGKQNLSQGTINFQLARTVSDRNYNSYGIFKYNGVFDNADVFVNQNFGKHFQGLAGINFQNLKLGDETLMKKNPSFSILSPYLSLFVRNVSGFSAELGGRYNRHSVYGSVFTYSINPSYFISNKAKFFANYSTGFKTPTLSELYGPSGANDKLKPQQSKSAEVGAHVFLMNGKVDIRATLFSRNIHNVIIYQSNGYINLNRQNDYGYEIEPTININNKLAVKTFFAFVTGDVTKKSASNKDSTYNNLIRRPKNSFGINVGYRFNNRFYSSLNIKMFGKRTDIDYKTYIDDNTYDLVYLAAYQLVDVYSEYRPYPWLRVFADLKNLLNQDYVETYGYTALRFNFNMGLNLTF